MKNSLHSAQREQNKIMTFTEYLTKLLLAVNDREMRIKFWENKILALDRANPDFAAGHYDMREYLIMVFILLLPFAAAFMDSVLVFSNLALIVPHSAWWTKLLLAGLVVGAEIAISYAVLYMNEDFRRRWITKLLPYTFIILLLGFTGIAIRYAAQGYEPTVDGSSFWSYMFPILVHNGLLFAGCALLHICLIKGAAHIHEYGSFALYKMRRFFLSLHISKGARGLNSPEGHTFVLGAPRLVHSIVTFRTTFPGVQIDFVGVMPEDTRIAINRVMGSEVLRRSNVSPYQNDMRMPPIGESHNS